METAFIFLPDAFTNHGYWLFARKTTLAAMLCYIIYSALDWPGTQYFGGYSSMVTALNTSGATRQKQALRLAGATAGDYRARLPCVPSSGTGLNHERDILVACVSGVQRLVCSRQPGLSYFGFQTALAFYLSFIQDYSARRQLAPASDRALGVLLGVGIMWLVFDTCAPCPRSSI